MISDSVDTVEYRRRDNYVYRLTVGEHLLVAMHAHGNEPLYALTPTGALLWEQLSAWSTVEQLANRLAEDYDVGPEDARRDVREFLEQLELLDAVEARGDAA
jgi:coenzyme PQQ synthesis protein D (PqqD)